MTGSPNEVSHCGDHRVVGLTKGFSCRKWWTAEKDLLPVLIAPWLWKCFLTSRDRSALLALCQPN